MGDTNFSSLQNVHEQVLEFMHRYAYYLVKFVFRNLIFSAGSIKQHFVHKLLVENEFCVSGLVVLSFVNTDYGGKSQHLV